MCEGQKSWPEKPAQVSTCPMPVWTYPILHSPYVNVGSPRQKTAQVASCCLPEHILRHGGLHLLPQKVQEAYQQLLCAKIHSSYRKSIGSYRKSIGIKTTLTARTYMYICSILNCKLGLNNEQSKVTKIKMKQMKNAIVRLTLTKPWKPASQMVNLVLWSGTALSGVSEFKCFYFYISSTVFFAAVFLQNETSGCLHTSAPQKISCNY